MEVIGAAQTYSKAPDRYPSGVPHSAAYARGAWVHQADGTRWVDTVSALGAVTLGHGREEVLHAARSQMERGVAFSLATELEQKVADEIAYMVPSHLDAVRYGKNGADVTGAAVRLARAVTGRSKVLMSSSGYHGHHDWSMTRPPMDGGIISAMKLNTVFYDHGDTDTVHKALEQHDVAAIVVEPIESGNPVEPPVGLTPWLYDLRRLADDYGALLVYDEVVTGMRVRNWTYANKMGAKGPDLLCMGKGIANGFPLSALMGRNEHMQRFTEDVFYSTTHGGEAVSLAAARATLQTARNIYFTAVVNEAGNRFHDEFNACTARHGIPAHTNGYGARPVMKFEDEEQRAKFLTGMTWRNVLCQGYVNFTAALAQPAVLDKLIDATVESLREVK